MIQLPYLRRLPWSLYIVSLEVKVLSDTLIENVSFTSAAAIFLKCIYIDVDIITTLVQLMTQAATHIKMSRDINQYQTTGKILACFSKKTFCLIQQTNWNSTVFIFNIYKHNIIN